jgi:hypothetical protein
MTRKLKKTSSDTRTIDLDDQYAVDFWTEQFRVTEVKLRTTVQSVGNAVADVKYDLRN